MIEDKEEAVFFKELRTNNFFDEKIRSECNRILECNQEEIDEQNKDIKRYEESIKQLKKEVDMDNKYEAEKQKLIDLNLSPEEYEKEIKKLAERLKI